MEPRRIFARLAAAMALCAIPMSVQAAPGGQLHTLMVGRWVCEQPGDATRAPVRQEADDFWAVQDSSYRVRGADGTKGGRGSYLLLGGQLVMTSGPFEGRRYSLESNATLRPLGPDGAELAQRCVKSGTPSVTVELPAPAKN